MKTRLAGRVVDVGSNAQTGFEVKLMQCGDVRSAHRVGLSLHLVFTL